MKKNQITLYRSLAWTALFVLWTAAIQVLDVQPIGPNGSNVGFARLNGTFHRLTGVHMNLYLITDWLSLIPVLIMISFAVLGLIQWIRRRHILKVDIDILLLGAFYLAVFGAYLYFEEFPVNHRPVLIDGFLESSYPSSTTLLVLTVMFSAVMQLRRCMRRSPLRNGLIALSMIFAALMVVGRLVSGVHWLTDIIGGGLLSGALTDLYAFSASMLTASTKQ